MILEKTPVTLAEVQHIIKDMEEKQALKEYLKKFNKLKKEKADELIEKLRALNNMKLREEHFIKIADFLPKEADDLNKILNETPLSEDEINAILSITKEY